MMMAHVDPTTLKISREISRDDILLSVAHLGDAGRVFVGSSDARVYELDTTQEKPEPVAMEGHQSYVTGLVQTGNTLISGSFDGYTSRNGTKLPWCSINRGKEILRAIRRSCMTANGTA